MSFDQDEHDRLCQQSYDARDAAWGRCGEVDPYVLAPMINPTFQGAPPWPNLRQAYRVVRGAAGTFLATDGLSDPFDESWEGAPRQNGFEMEVYGLTDEEGPMQEHWLFPIVAGFARLVADYRDLSSTLAELRVLSTELYDVPIPEDHRGRFVNAEERVGVLVGIEAPPVPGRVEGPLSPIRLVNLKLLTLSELGYAVEHGEAGRTELLRRFLASDRPLHSSLDREAVA